MAEARFLIDGEEYPLPGLESFNMDEAQILYETCGLSVEDFAIDDDDPEQVAELEQKTRNPGFIKALMIVALLRGKKGMSRSRATSTIGNSNLVQILAEMKEGEDPTEPQKSEPSTESSPTSLVSNGDSSGSDSETSGSKELELFPAATGTSE